MTSEANNPPPKKRRRPAVPPQLPNAPDPVGASGTEESKALLHGSGDTESAGRAGESGNAVQQQSVKQTDGSSDSDQQGERKRLPPRASTESAEPAVRKTRRLKSTPPAATGALQAPPLEPGKRPSVPPSGSVMAAEAIDAMDAAGQDGQASDERPSSSPDSDSRIGQARALLRICEEQLVDAAEPARKARLHYEAGRLLEAPIWDFSASADHYEQARKLWPEHVPTLRGLRRVQTALGRYSAIPALFDAEIRVTRESSRRAMLFYEKGCVYRDSLEDAREARAAFSSAVELDPSNLSLLEAVRLAELAAGGWNQLDKAYELTAVALGSDTRQRSAILVERARLVASKMRDLALATSLYEGALQVDPNSPRAVRELKRLLYAQGRWLELSEVLSRESSQTEDPARRALLLYDAGRLQSERIGNVASALPLLEAAHSAAPDDQTILEELSRHYELSGRWDSFAATLEQLAAASSSTSEKLHRLHRLGQIYAEHLSDMGKAVDRQKSVLAINGSFSPALQALEALYRSTDSFPELLEMYRAEADAASTAAQQADALIRVAQVAEEKLANPAEAISSYQQALAVVPADVRAFKALVRLYYDAKDYARLAELYRREVARVPDTETKRTYLFKLGRLEEDDLGVPGHAVATYRQILEMEPNHSEAIHALQRAAERAQMWPELASALEAEAKTLRDPTGLLPLWHRLGEVYESHLDDLLSAQGWYRKVLARDDCHVPTLRSLGRVYSAQGHWNDVLAIHQLELKVSPQPAAKAELLFKMGQLCEAALADEAEALSNYRKALQFEAGHLPSLRALQALLSRRQEWNELVRLIQMEAATHEEPASRARAKFRVGEIYEHRLSTADLALAAYSESLEEVADFLPAVEARTRLLELSGDHQGLSVALEKEAEAANSARATVDASLGRAQVMYESLKSPAEAAEVYESILEQDPIQVGALLALEEIYVGLGKYAELAHVHKRQAEIYEHPGAIVSALRELGRVQETHRLVEGPEVAKTYLSIVQLSPADGEVLTTLERLAIAQQDWPLLRKIDEQLAQCSDDAAVVAAHQTRLGEAQEFAGEQDALGTYRQALAHDTDSLGATRGLSRLASVGSDADLMAEAAEYEARVIGNRDEAAGLLTRSAATRTAPDLSARDLARALELHPDHRPAAEALVTLMTAERQFESLIQLLTHAAQDASDNERRANLRIEIAKIQLQNLQDSGAAIASAQRAVKERPNYPRALMTLGNLYAGVRQWREAVRWLRQALDAEPAATLAQWGQLELARILLDRLGDAEGSVTLLTELLEQESHHQDALGLMIRAQVTLGQLDEATRVAGTLVDACETDEQRSDAYVQVANLELTRGDENAAMGGYQQAVALTGLQGNAAAEFKAFLSNRDQRGESSQWQVYADALREYLSAHRLGMGHVHLELSRVLGDSLGDPNQALTVLRQGIAATEDNEVLRLEMAQRLTVAGDAKRAVGEYLFLLGQSPLQPVYWRQLSRAFKAMQSEEQSRLALGPLVTLNQADQLEQATYSMRPPRPEAAGAGLFDAPAYRAVDVHSADDLPTTQLLASLSGAAYKLYAADWSVYGVSPRDRIGSRSSHPVRALAERVAGVLGVEDFDLYVHPAPLRRVDIELTETPAIMVPKQVAALAEPLQYFLIARAMSSIARRTHVAEKLSVKQVRYLVAAAIRHIDSSYTVDFVDAETLQQESKRVLKALPWRNRKSMEEAARAYLAGSHTPLVDWKFREKVTAARIATVLSDDLAGATAILLQSEMDLSAEDAGQQPAEDLPAAVLAFSVSDAAMQLRRRLNLNFQ